MCSETQLRSGQKCPKRQKASLPARRKLSPERFEWGQNNFEETDKQGHLKCLLCSEESLHPLGYYRASNPCGSTKIPDWNYGDRVEYQNANDGGDANQPTGLVLPDKLKCHRKRRSIPAT